LEEGKKKKEDEDEDVEILMSDGEKRKSQTGRAELLIHEKQICLSESQS
jgi:hypothetical protein